MQIFIANNINGEDVNFHKEEKARIESLIEKF